MIEKKCIMCGKTFSVRNYRKETARFCSKSCCAKYNYQKFLSKADQTHKIGNQYRKGKRPTNAFEKGHEPWNKGLRGIHLSSATEFKKGQRGINYVPVGTIRTRKEKGKPRQFIKVSDPNIWEYYAVYLWEQKYGKIPQGYVIHHINKNRLDDRIENLVCVSRSEHINIHRKDLKTTD